MSSEKTKMNSKKRDKFVRYSEGATMYHMEQSKFMQLAKDAKACYKVGQMVLVNTELFEKYLEQFREPSRPLPKHTWGNLPSKVNTPKNGANT